MAFMQAGSCVLDTPLGKDVLVPTRVTVVESLSQLFEMEMDLVSHQSVKPEDIVGKSVTLEVRISDDASRYLNGIVSSVAQGVQRRDDILTYRAEVVPWVWLLTRCSNCRVWENKTALEIIESVLGDKKYGGGAYEFSNLGGTYEPIDYCVQYQETDFDFVMRIMENEGLGFGFRHEKGNHTLVIFDTSPGLADCPSFETMTYAGTTVPEGRVDEIEDWCVQQGLPAGRLAINGYDFKNPSDDLLALTQSKLSLGGNASYEIYEFPAGYCDSKQGNRYAKLKMEAVEAESHQIFGSSVCPGLAVGTHITLKQHYEDSFNNQRYLLTRVEHAITQAIGYEDSGTSYQNTFTCLPDRIPYRPPRRAVKPRIHGIQTALVVGPEGEEIHCDEYGRVRIQFRWDRDGKGDGTNVCWARCAQSVAGKRWGGIFIPRIGQEVVVQFLDGDPDRPLITGVVYNGEQMPPYELPAHKTRSGIKTRSSKKGTPDNYNEIRFEDKKGEESLTIHAEKDMDATAKKTITIKARDAITLDCGDGKSKIVLKKDGTVQIEGIGIAIKGANLLSEATGPNTVKGSVVMLNP